MKRVTQVISMLGARSADFRRLCLGGLLGCACTDRAVGGDDGQGPNATIPESGTADEVGESVAGGEHSGGEPVPFIDCVPALYSPPVFVPGCGGGYNATLNEAWADFACGNCVCAEHCESDDDCLPRPAAVPSRCTETTNPEVNVCLLQCDDDDDCPGDMACLPSMHVAVSACYFVWRRPECCDPDQGGPGWGCI